MSGKRVFILGAGFSKQAGMPLSKELTDILVEKTNSEDFRNWYDSLKKRVYCIEKEPDNLKTNLNFEEVFDFAPFDIMTWRMRHMIYPTDSAGDVPKQYAEDIENWLVQMEGQLWHIILEKQKEAIAKPNLISGFSENLTTEDSIITFNYDTLLEASLSEQKSWHYGFEEENGKGISILKMHGSINWLKVLNGSKEQNDTDRYKRLFTGTLIHKYLNGNGYYKTKGFSYHLLRHRECSPSKLYGDLCFRYQPAKNQRGIAGLGRYKPLDQLPGSYVVWFNAIQALREAEEVYVIGFSLSPFDSMARLHFGDCMMHRYEENRMPEKITIIDPYACELLPRFHSVFGQKPPIEIINKPAEQVDWSSFLR